MHFVKAHAYGNDFLYVERRAAAPRDPARLARELCDRHSGVGADGLIVFERSGDGAAMTLFNADGSRAEVSGNGVRGLAALLLTGAPAGAGSELTIQTDAGAKRLTLTGFDGGRPTFRAAMGLPRDLRRVPAHVAGEPLQLVVMDFGNPQCVVLGALPDEARFARLGAALERHDLFPHGTNVEFAEVDPAGDVRILIWERGVGPTRSSGTGSCASLVAAASYGAARRDATIVAPGGPQRVEWRDDSVYLTGWAEVVCEGEWLRAESSYPRP
jgi:diaminopimelate epimerase